LNLLKKKNEDRRLTVGSRGIEKSGDSRSSTCEVRLSNCTEVVKKKKKKKKREGIELKEEVGQRKVRG